MRWILSSTWEILSGVGPEAYWWKPCASPCYTGFPFIIQLSNARWQVCMCFILKCTLISAADCFFWMKDMVIGIMVVPWNTNQLKSCVNEKGNCHATPGPKRASNMHFLSDFHQNLSSHHCIKLFLKYSYAKSKSYRSPYKIYSLKAFIYPAVNLDKASEKLPSLRCHQRAIQIFLSTNQIYSVVSLKYPAYIQRNLIPNR